VQSCSSLFPFCFLFQYFSLSQLHLPYASKRRNKNQYSNFFCVLVILYLLLQIRQCNVCIFLDLFYLLLFSEHLMLLIILYDKHLIISQRSGIAKLFTHLSHFIAQPKFVLVSFVMTCIQCFLTRKLCLLFLCYMST
jgi:hypothetical protein